MPSTDRQTVAALFPPWWTGAEIAEAAVSAGDIVRIGTVPWVFIVRSVRPGLAGRLRATGALLVFSALGRGSCETVASGGHAL